MSEVISDKSNSEVDKQYFLRLESSGLQYPIPRGRTVIGRAPSCDVLLTEGATSVSRKHAEIQRTGNTLRISDLGSRNHTSVNERDIHGAGYVPIRAGDRITICQYEFTLLEEGHELSGTCRIEEDSVGESGLLAVGRSASVATHQNKQLTALVSISRSLASVLNTEDVLQTAIDTLLDVFPAADRCVIGFIEPEGSFEARWWKLRQANASETITVSMSVVRKILESGESILYEDAVSALPEGKSVLAMNLRSIMCAPLLDAEGQVFGMLQLDSSRVRRFDQSDLEVLSAVAIQIGLALNVSRLHAKVVEDLLLRSDLEQARAVQKQFLPTVSPELSQYEFADYYSPARHLGGDYFDYIPLGEQRLAIVLGDVVGKGAPAALNMVRLATETRATFEISESPAEVMTRLNRRLSGAFVTCVLIVLDAHQHTITITNAGHELPLLKSKDGRVRALGDEVTDVPLSVMEQIVYREQSYPIQAGDALFVFSDGFVDAENATEAIRFGRERLESIVAAPAAKPREIIDTLVGQIQQFTAGSTQFDDMCLVCVHRDAEFPS